VWNEAEAAGGGGEPVVPVFDRAAAVQGEQVDAVRGVVVGGGGVRGEDERGSRVPAVPRDVDAGVFGDELAQFVTVVVGVDVDADDGEQVMVGLVGEVGEVRSGGARGGRVVSGEAGTVGGVGGGELPGLVSAAEVVAIEQ
jgi:hypothetical protein